jgi:hypothetical protein
MNNAQLDIEAIFKQGDFRPLEFELRSGKTITATRNAKQQRWTILRDREVVGGQTFTDGEALARLSALAGQSVGLLRVG